MVLNNMFMLPPPTQPKKQNSFYRLSLEEKSHDRVRLATFTHCSTLGAQHRASDAADVGYIEIDWVNELVQSLIFDTGFEIQVTSLFYLDYTYSHKFDITFFPFKI